MKTIIAPVVYIVTAATIGSFAQVVEFAALWVILEFFFYYARYQWNDVRGLDNDRVHPARLLRARLPVGHSNKECHRNVQVSLRVASARVVLALLIAVALGLIEAVLILGITLASAAAVYEGLRNRPPGQFLYTTQPREIGVWLAVGLGYAVRAGLGFALAGLALGSVAMNVGLLFAFAFGIMYVLLGWALEASNFCARVRDGLLATNEVQRKPHISALVRYLDDPPIDASSVITTAEPISRDTPGYLGSIRVLNACSGTICPWNLALVIGATLSGLLGTQLAAAPGSASAIAVVLCFGGATAVRRTASTTIRWATILAVVFALGLLAQILRQAPALEQI